MLELDRGDARRKHHRGVREDRARLDRVGAPSDASRPYTEMVYQPMLELLAYLRANGFKTFIVSGGGVEFMRPWTERVYGIPPEQVVGSRAKMKYELRGRRRCCCGCRDRSRRRQGRQAGRHSAGHRPPADCGVRQFGRRLRDARMDDVGTGPALGCDRSSHRCRARVGLRSRLTIGRLERGLDEAAGAAVDPGRYETGLASNLSGRGEAVTKRPEPRSRA